MNFIGREQELAILKEAFDGRGNERYEACDDAVQVLPPQPYLEDVTDLSCILFSFCSRIG